MAPKNIVLLHGWGANTKKLAPLANSLKKLNWKVLVCELPGFDAPEPDSIWNVDDYTRFVVRRAFSIFGKEKYFVFGHSFGGRVAIKMSLYEENPICGVVLCATGGISRGNLIKRLLFKSLAVLGKVFANISPEFGHYWKTLLYKIAREHDYERASSRMKKVFQKVIAEDLKPLIPEIKIPLLVLWGEEDKITPVKDAYFIARNSKKASIFTYQNEGHRLPYERPDDVAEKIDQWAKNF